MLGDYDPHAAEVGVTSGRIRWIACRTNEGRNVYPHVASMLHGIAGNPQKRGENGGNAGKLDAT